MSKEIATMPDGDELSFDPRLVELAQQSAGYIDEPEGAASHEVMAVSVRPNSIIMDSIQRLSGWFEGHRKVKVAAEALGIVVTAAAGVEVGRRTVSGHR